MQTSSAQCCRPQTVRVQLLLGERFSARLLLLRGRNVAE